MIYRNRLQLVLVWVLVPVLVPVKVQLVLVLVLVWVQEKVLLFLVRRSEQKMALVEIQVKVPLL
mgnify:CR=1 FL=1